MDKDKWAIIDEPFNDREEFLVGEHIDVRDLVYLGNKSDFNLKIKRDNGTIYGRGYCTRIDGASLFIGNYRLFVKNPENNQRVKDFLLELLQKKLIKRKDKGE